MTTNMVTILNALSKECARHISCGSCPEAANRLCDMFYGAPINFKKENTLKLLKNFVSKLPKTSKTKKTKK